MAQIPPIDDAYINEIIKSKGRSNPALLTTQGVKMLELIKLLRDRIEQVDTDSVHKTGDERISGTKAFTIIKAEALSVNNLDNPSLDTVISPITGVQTKLLKITEGAFGVQLSASVLAASRSQLLQDRDGVVALTSDLTAFPTQSELDAGLASKIDNSQRGVPGGVSTLDSGGKILTSQLPDSISGALTYRGTWNATTNTPALANPPASSTKGHYYVTNVGGTQFGITFVVGDWIVSNGTEWQKVDNTDAVASVFGRIGNILADESDYSAYYPLLSGSYVNPSWLMALPYAKITNTPTTLGGFGITDGYTKTESDGRYPVKDGTGATGTWAIGISGHAATATNSDQWGGKAVDYISGAVVPAAILVTDNSDGMVRSLSKSAFQNWAEVTPGGETLLSVMARNNTSPNLMYLTGANNPTPPTAGKSLSFQRQATYSIVDSYNHDTSTGESLILNPSFGNVGIGTTTPGAKLDVNGDGNFLGSVTINSNNGQLRLKKNVAGSGTGGSWISFQSSVGTEEALIGFGSVGNPTFTIGNSVGGNSYLGSSHTFNNAITAPTFNGNLVATTAKVANAPVNPSDVVRKQDLDAGLPIIEIKNSGFTIPLGRLNATYLCGHNIDVMFPNAKTCPIGMLVTLRGIASANVFYMIGNGSNQLETSTFGTFSSAYAEPGGASKVYVFQNDGVVWRRIR